jgi:hypothetical protein
MTAAAAAPHINSCTGDCDLGEERHRKVASGIAVQVLHDALGLPIIGVTEIGRNP